MKIKKYFYAIFLLLVSSIYSIGPLAAHAETHISGGTISVPTVWTKEGSPYILDKNTTFNSNAPLTINAGVTVTLGTSTSRPFIWMNGGLSVKGTKDEPVYFKNLDSVHLGRNPADIRYTVFDQIGTLLIVKGSSTIDHSTFTGNTDGLRLMGSKILVTNSKFQNNETGIRSLSSTATLVGVINPDAIG